jgi:DNA-binding MarR family transcriptional regulator
MITESHTSSLAGSAELAERLVALFAAIGRRSVGDLATRLGISAATASRACDGLSRAGLVERREDAEDRRVKRVHATETGIAYVEQFAAAKLDAVREMLKSLDADQQQRLFEALAPLAQMGCAR